MIVENRKTITVTKENFARYSKLKGRHLLMMGKPELSFTEFANVSMEIADLTMDQLLEFRRKRSNAK